MLALCLLQNHAIGAYGEVQVWFHAFVAQIVNGGEWSGSSLGRFVRQKNCRYDMGRGGPQGRWGTLGNLGIIETVWEKR